MLRDAFASGTDDGLKQFIDSFEELRKRFVEGSNVFTLKTVRNIEHGVLELSESLDEIKDFGRHM
jgi:hypothetical protein